MSKIAIVGTGRMGTAFAKRLLEAGNEVTVWNRSAKKNGCCCRSWCSGGPGSGRGGGLK